MAQNNTIHNILEVVVGTADIRSSFGALSLMIQSGETIDKRVYMPR